MCTCIRDLANSCFEDLKSQGQCCINSNCFKSTSRTCSNCLGRSWTILSKGLSCAFSSFIRLAAEEKIFSFLVGPFYGGIAWGICYWGGASIQHTAYISVGTAVGISALFVFCYRRGEQFDRRVHPQELEP